MKLKKVRLHNFRGYIDAEVSFDKDLTTIVGKNDVGKSTILDALEIFFNNKLIKIDSNDGNIKSDKSDVSITCEFCDLPNEIVIDATESTNLAREYLTNSEGNLEIIKQYDTSKKSVNASIFANAYYPTNPELKELLYQTNTSLRKEVKSISKVNENKKVNLKINSSMRKAIRDYYVINKCKNTIIDLNKADGKKIWQQLEKNLPIFALFQSDRPSTDSDAEVQDPMMVATKEAIKESQEELKHIQDQVKSSVTEVANKTIEKLKEMAPDIAEGLNPIFSTEPNWSKLFKFEIEDEDGIPLNKRGSGVRRLVLLNFFRAKASEELLNIEKKQRANIIYAIEEPETAQHPDNQRLIMNSLLELSLHDNCQVIMTTHLPETAKLTPISGVRLIKKMNGVREVVDGTSDESVLSEVARELGIYPNLNSPKLIVYVEGPTDALFLAHISKKLSLISDKYVDLKKTDKVMIIPLGGTTLRDWVNNEYLKALHVSSMYLFDKDKNSEHEKDVENAKKHEDCVYAKLTGKREIENYIAPKSIQRYYQQFKVTIPDMDAETDVPKTVKEIKGRRETVIKRELNSQVVDFMSIDEFIENDSDCFMQNFLTKICSYAK